MKISGSDLAGARTPAEFYQRKFIHPPLEKDYFDIGTAAHAYILEPDTFNDLIHVVGDWPEPDKLNIDGTYSKVGANGKYWKEQKELNSDKIVFEPVTFTNVLKYAESIKQIPGFDKFINLETGKTEVELETADETGLTLRGRIDYAKPGKFLADLKFSKSIADRDIYSDFKDFEYHLRSAFYLDLWNRCTGENLDTFIYVCVEKSDRPSARFLKVSQMDINAGREMYRVRLDVIAECERTGEWILNSIENLTLPEWVYNKTLNW